MSIEGFLSMEPIIIKSWHVHVRSVEFNLPVLGTWYVHKFVSCKFAEHGAGIVVLLARVGVGAVVDQPHGHQAVLQAGVRFFEHRVNVPVAELSGLWIGKRFW